MNNIEFISEKFYQEFASKFISEYFGRGFGYMTKNDLEILMFDSMVKYGHISEMSSFDISCMLKIPESKVKRLRYEASIKYGNHDIKVFKKKLYLVLRSAEYIADKNIIKFSIDDKFLRMQFYSELKRINAFADTSHITDIVVVDKNLLGKLLYKLFIEENADLIIEKVEEAVDDQYDRKLDFIDNFNKIVTTTESLIKFISVIGNIGMTVAPLVQ